MADLSLIPIPFLAFLGFTTKETLILICHGQSLWNDNFFL
jgi:hypothetical protein